MKWRHLMPYLQIHGIIHVDLLQFALWQDGRHWHELAIGNGLRCVAVLAPITEVDHLPRNAETNHEMFVELGWDVFNLSVSVPNILENPNSTHVFDRAFCCLSWLAENRREKKNRRKNWCAKPSPKLNSKSINIYMGFSAYKLHINIILMHKSIKTLGTNAQNFDLLHKTCRKMFKTFQKNVFQVSDRDPCARSRACNTRTRSKPENRPCKRDQKKLVASAWRIFSAICCSTRKVQCC